jgi:hypothetical protein
MLSATKYDSGQFQNHFHASRSTPFAGGIRKTVVTVARRRGFLHGIARYDDSEYSGAGHRQSACRRTPQHEGRHVKLHSQLGHELLELTKDKAWLVKVANAVNLHWQRNNAAKKL